MTVKQAAERLEISQSLVYGLVAAGKLRYARIGNGRGRIRITEEAVEEYLARCTFEAREEKPVASVHRLKHIKL